MANICLHLIIEAERDASGVTPGKRYATERGFSKLYVSGINLVLANNTFVGLEFADVEHCFCVYVIEGACAGAGLHVSGMYMWESRLVIAFRKAPIIRRATDSPRFPPPGTHTPVGPAFKYTRLQLQTSKLPLREQLSARESLSCDLWSMGVAHWAN